MTHFTAAHGVRCVWRAGRREPSPCCRGVLAAAEVKFLRCRDAAGVEVPLATCPKCGVLLEEVARG